MALNINNSLNTSLPRSTPAVPLGTQSGTMLSPTKGLTSQPQGTLYGSPQQAISGLVSPVAHPALATASPSVGPVTSMTVKSDGTVTTKHATDNQSLASKPVDTTQSTAPQSTGGSQSAPAMQPTPATAPQTPTFAGVTGALSRFDPFANPAVSGAYEKAQGAQAELEQLKQQEAEALKTAGGQPMPIGELLGRQGLLANYYTAKENAAAQALAGYGSLYQGGFTGTGQRASALSSAAGLAKGAPTAFGQGVYDPLTGQIESGGGQFGTGPAAAANVGSIQDMTAQINNYASARSQANSVVTNQLAPLLTQNGINPSDFNAVNQFLQKLAGQTSNPQYQTYQNIINDLASRYAQILTPAGGNITDYKAQIAQSLINATASGQSLLQVIQELDKTSQLVIQGITDTRDKLQSGRNVNTPAQTGPASTQGSSTDPLGIL